MYLVKRQHSWIEKPDFGGPTKGYKGILSHGLIVCDACSEMSEGVDLQIPPVPGAGDGVCGRPMRVREGGLK
jgi:hypothetical protein